MSENEPGACCAPSPGRRADSGVVEQVEANADGGTHGMVRISGGTCVVGTDDADAYPDDGETPARRVEVAPFRISRTAVSNAEFAAFVEATGYRTEAERFGWSFVFGGLLPDDFPPTRGVAAAPWWRVVEGASWWAPEGPQSGIDGRRDHPVVHVTWADAEQYCRWAGLRLPTEAEWECAARGGLEDVAFPWGSELEPGGQHRMNVWQGTFPQHNTRADGWYGTCPVEEFEPNGFGLYNATGNVWEWCGDTFRSAHTGTNSASSPTEADEGARKIAKGGSYLCHESYCRRYRVSARQGPAPDTSIGNIGFRCARSA